MSKVKKITVSNLKAVADLTADFNGCTAIITGGNDKGKSSFLKSLPDRLRGIKPEIILKEGENEGFAEWVLTTGERFLWKFDNKTKAGEKLTFISEKNISSSITKEISEMFFPKTFDIDVFLNSTPKAQKKILQEVVGLDFTDVEQRFKDAYEDRTYVNKVYAQARAKEIKKVMGAPDKEVDVMPIQEEISSIKAYNEKIEYVLRGITDKEQQAKALEEEVKKLEAEVKAKVENISNLQKDIESGITWMSKNRPKKKEDKEALEEKLKKALEANLDVRHNLEVIKISEEIKEARVKAEKADELVKSIEQEKLDMIKKAELPDGFDFTEDGITYKGHALSKDQLSSSSIYIASLKLASMNLGQVRTLHFDASYLDRNSLKDIEKWANENDLQLLIERPDFDGGEIEYHILEE